MQAIQVMLAMQVIQPDRVEGGPAAERETPARARVETGWALVPAIALGMGWATAASRIAAETVAGTWRGIGEARAAADLPVARFR